MPYQDRVARLRETLREQNCEAALISHPDNRRYLSGFTGKDMPPLDSAGYLFVDAQTITLVTDFRYVHQAEGETFAKVVSSNGEGIAQKIAEFHKERPFQRLAFESNHLLHAHFARLEESLFGVTLVPTFDMVERQRIIKDENEIKALKHAIRLADIAFDWVADELRAGLTEKKVAQMIDDKMRELGAVGPSFDTIIGSGPNGAMPHAVISDRMIQEEEPIVIDMGALVGGYISDMTRTVILGKPTDKFKEIYNIVLEAQEAAIKGLRPGMTGHQVDALAREVIAQYGYGEQFGHGLGHGVGLQVHEAPHIRPEAKNVLVPGMVHSIEPGVYLPGWGGVRIEDLVLVTETGAEVLTGARKAPRY